MPVDVLPPAWHALVKQLLHHVHQDRGPCHEADGGDDADDGGGQVERPDHHGSGLQRRAGAAVCQLRQRHHLVSKRLL